MFSLVLALVASIGAVAASVRCHGRVLRAAPRETENVVRSFSGEPKPDLPKISELLRRAGCPLDAELEGGSLASIAMELDEHLSDVDASLRRAGPVPFAAARVALFSGTFAAVLELPGIVANGASGLGAIAPFLVGALGAGISWELGARLERRSEKVREEWDRIGRSLSAVLKGDPSVTIGAKKAANLV